MMGQILVGDCRETLRTLPEASVHCCVTSPPYWGLRDYGLPPTIWGGDKDCEHEWEQHVKPAANGIVNPDGMTAETLSGNSATRKPIISAFCQQCGAWRGCLGLEPTPDMFVDHLVAVFREVRRVLRDDGTLWLNLGDSYTSGGRISHGTRVGYKQQTNRGSNGESDAPRAPQPPGLKSGDLCGIPWRVALALQADGWWLRSDIIWAKPNPMPESVTSRPSSAHEHVFLLAKSARYYYDAEAVREPHKEVSLKRVQSGLTHRHPDGIGVAIPPVDTERMGERFCPPGGRNIRTVWTIPTRSFPGSHFATFPPALVEPCVKAGTSAKGCCPECGAPWERVVERTDQPDTSAKGSRFDAGKTAARDGGDRTQQGERKTTRTVGWRPGCSCDAGEPVPCTVLDPFFGSGTTGLVAARLGRDWIGCEMNEEYAKLAQDRIDHGGNWTEVEQAKAGQKRLLEVPS